MFGFININKPPDCTSRSSVNDVQKLVRPDRVGHAGTLDPLATGVLVICVGPATRLAKYVQAMPKTYVADFRLGMESDTEDILGQVEPVPNAPEISPAQIVDILPEFLGSIMQVPPKFSALKVKGQRAYHLARDGQEVKLEQRRIELLELELLRFAYPDFRLLIRCGSGTYVRSLGRDLGRRLGSGAIMVGLERTAIGDFRIEDATSPEQLSKETIHQHLIIPQHGIPDMPQISVPDEQAEKFANGHTWDDEPIDSEEAFAIDQSGRLLTILKQRSPGFFTPAVNFSKYWLATGVDQQRALSSNGR